MNLPDRIPTSTHRWERHHREIVELAAAGDAQRASALLREHLQEVGCDPIAVRAVLDGLTDVGQVAGTRDLVGRLAPCPICSTAWHP